MASSPAQSSARNKQLTNTLIQNLALKNQDTLYSPEHKTDRDTGVYIVRKTSSTTTTRSHSIMLEPVKKGQFQSKAIPIQGSKKRLQKAGTKTTFCQTSTTRKRKRPENISKTNEPKQVTGFNSIPKKFYNFLCWGLTVRS